MIDWLSNGVVIVVCTYRDVAAAHSFITAAKDGDNVPCPPDLRFGPDAIPRENRHTLEVRAVVARRLQTQPANLALDVCGAAQIVRCACSPPAHRIVSENVE